MRGGSKGPVKRPVRTVNAHKRKRGALNNLSLPSLYDTRLTEWVRTYLDLDKTMGALFHQSEKLEPMLRINVTRLIQQLSASKRKLERRISNRLLLEKHHLGMKIKGLTGQLSDSEK